MTEGDWVHPGTSFVIGLFAISGVYAVVDAIKSIAKSFRRRTSL